MQFMRYPPGIIPGAGFYGDSTDAADGFLAGLEEVSIALKLLDKTLLQREKYIAQYFETTKVLLPDRIRSISTVTIVSLQVAYKEKLPSRLAAFEASPSIHPSINPCFRSCLSCNSHAAMATG
jgi:hypothetical protein